MFYFTDPHGRILDESLRPPPDGQQGPGSIFHVPSSETKAAHKAQSGKITSVEDLLKASEYHGFERRNQYKTSNIIMLLTDDPKEKSRPPSPPPSQFNALSSEALSGATHYTACAFCWAVVKGKERWKGFTLKELNGAARQGCDTCNVLQKSIRHFTDIIFPTYEDEKVRVCQSVDHPLKLLSQTKKVSITFEEHGGETISMQFGDQLTQGVQDTKRVGGRIIDTSSEEAHDLVKGWLTTCSKNHEACGIPPSSALPRRVLDVSGSEVRLLETQGRKAPYVTLSHCWGRQSVTKVTKATIGAMKRQVPFSDLSRTFHDAVTITRKLGFQYLWIDGLCILQDDQEEWEIEVSNMSRIFANSQLTIAASRATDGSEGCWSSRLKEPFHLRCTNDREIRDPLLWQPYQIEGLDRDGFPKTFSVSLGFPHGIFRRKRPAEPLLKRAWVFQEQILSPRIIHYASGELFFECKTHIACECSGWSVRSQSWDWETRWRKAHNVLVNQDKSNRTVLGDLQQNLREFEAYKTLIETYTELDITNDLDRLPALSGLTLGRNDEYLAGMWKSFFLMTLHWIPELGSPKGIMARRPHEYRAPTWSWASMEAPIRHIGSDAVNVPFNAKLEAKILDVSCTAEGADPRGRLRDGYLRIQGPGCIAKVTHIGICEREAWGHEAHLQKMADGNLGTIDRALLDPEQSRLCTYVTIRRGSGAEKEEAHCYLDLPLVLARDNPAEVAVGDEVVCLVVSKQLILILRPSRTVSGVFYRVGVLRHTQGLSMETAVVTIR